MWLARVFGISINNVDMEPPRPTRAPSVLLGREKEVEGGRNRSAKSRTIQATRVLYLSPLNLASRIGNSYLRDCFGRKPVQRFHDSNQLLCR